MKPIKVKNLILHIGSHKTGSTYIQKEFKENRAVLAEHTLLYPKAGCGLLFGHHEIVNEIKSESEVLDLIFNAMANELEEHHKTILLSSENFEYLSAEEIARLLSYFDFEHIKIIYLYRAWTPLIYAMWQEEIKHGSTMGFDSYCVRHIGFPISSNLLNYSMALGRYEEIVGRENIFVASYEALKNRDLVGFICSLIGIENGLIVGGGERVNSSFDPFLVEIIRVMNEFASKENYRPSYLPKHLYINKACSGSNGMARDERMREVMARYLTKTYDYTQSFAFRNVYQQFFDKYSVCFVDGVSEVRTILDAKYDPPSSVNSGYLLDIDVLEDLNSAWLIVREEMNRVR